MAAIRFDHVQIYAKDPRVAADWFARHLGAAVQPGPGRVEVTVGGLVLFVARGPGAVADGPAHPHAGTDHIGFAVDDIDGLVAGLVASGVRITRDVSVLRPGVRAAFVEGPEGVSIELIERAG